jgi:hypothetical protein
MKKKPHKKIPKKPKPTKEINNKLFTAISTILVAILILVASVSYFLFNKDTNKTINNPIQHTTKNKTIKQPSITFEEKTKALEIEYIDNVDNNIYVEEQKKQKIKTPTFHYEEPNYGDVDNDIQQPHEIVKKQIVAPKPKPIKKIIKKDTIVVKPIKKQHQYQKIKHNKPLLAIIIDDVTTSSQIKKIKNIGYIVNMSFLPPTQGHKKSAKITKHLDNYMIHLPLQASSSRYEETNTLYITDTIDTIDKRIKMLKALYPKAKYINNHTGSKFTSNQVAMDKLFKVLKKYNYMFVDSRTTAKTVAGLSAKKYGVKMLSRNIFLDNKKNTKYIQNQLKKAIKNAKKYGIAIAIGHPYNLTFQTLKHSKYLLDEVDLVYIDQL